VGLFALAGPLSWVLIKNVFRNTAPPIVAVIPFEYPANDEKGRFFAEGLKKELVRRLSMEGDIRMMVLPTGFSARSYAESGGPPLPAADFTMHGEIEKPQEIGKSEDEIVWKLRLENSSKGERFWEKSWRGDMVDFLKPLSEAVQGIRDTLELRDLRGGAPVVRNGSDVFTEYLQGSYLLSMIGFEKKDPQVLLAKGKFYSNQGDEQANELAIRCFQTALQNDSSFGLAYLGLAKCFLNYIQFGWKFDIQWLDKAEEMLSQAAPFCSRDSEYFRLQIETRLVREIAFGGDSSQVYFDLAKEGLALDPCNAGLNSIAGYCYYHRFDLQGRESDLDEALRFKKIAFWLEQNSIGNIVYAQILMLKRRFSEALNVCSVLDNNLESDFVDFQRGEIQYYQGDFEACEPLFSASGEDLSLRSYMLHFLGMIAVRKNDREAALKILKEIELLAPKKSAVLDSVLRRASIYAGLGDVRKASELLGNIFASNSSGNGNYVFRRLIELDRNFDNVRYTLKMSY